MLTSSQVKCKALKIVSIQTQRCSRRRSATRTAGPTTQFPFPTHANPTPYEIFHLPRGASKKDVKSRYYDLVRLHHPDSPSCRSLNSSSTSEELHERFRNVTAAYHAIQAGRGALPLSNTASHHHSHPHSFHHDDPRHWGYYAEEIARRQRLFHLHRQRQGGEHTKYANPGGYKWDSNPDDRWKDQLILGFGIISLAVGIAPQLFLYPFHMRQRHNEAVRNLRDAREAASTVRPRKRKEDKDLETA